MGNLIRISVGSVIPSPKKNPNHHQDEGNAEEEKFAREAWGESFAEPKKKDAFGVWFIPPKNS